jgi:putative SOS response-associated peptidase YedK
LAVLTARADGPVRPFQRRKPVVVAERDHGRWLSREVRDPALLAPVLRRSAPDELRAVPRGPCEAANLAV